MRRKRVARILPRPNQPDTGVATEGVRACEGGAVEGRAREGGAVAGGAVEGGAVAGGAEGPRDNV